MEEQEKYGIQADKRLRNSESGQSENEINAEYADSPFMVITESNQEKVTDQYCEFNG